MLEGFGNAVIDTSYSGFLTLPPALVADPYACNNRVTLADDTKVGFRVRRVTVLRDSKPML